MITDDELILYYYRELDAADRARIGAALGEQPELSRRLHALVARLDSAAAIAEVPVPAQTQQRWETALARATTRTARLAETPRRTLKVWHWIPAAAAAAIAVMVGINQLGPTAPTPDSGEVTVSTPPAGTGDATAYENGLKFHLASTERQLASLGDATPEERARLVETIIGQNRIYALAAERAGEPQLARVLRAFTPVLESVAKDDGEMAADDLAQLSFELRVMQARLRADRPSTTL
jgi:hypothetical protein